MLEKVRLPEITGAYIDFVYLTDDVIAFWTYDYKKRLKYYSKSKDEIILESFPEKRTYGFGTFELRSSVLGRPFTNTVYGLRENGEYEIFHWNFKNLNNTKLMNRHLEEKSRQESSFEETLTVHDEILNSKLLNYVFSSHFVNDTYQYAGIIRNNKYYNLFYNKQNNQHCLFEKTIENVTVYPISMDNECVWGIYEREWNEILNSSFLSNQDNFRLSNYNPEFDNPIIVKYNF